jgi:pimeloyl-ACP methyl ester carboxylesterase
MWKQAGMIVVAAALVMGGCTQMLAENLVTPPNKWEPHIALNNPADGEAIKVPVGPPEATLAAWMLSPPADRPCRGTILLLHGILADHGWVRNTAHVLQDAGYRAVMVDLRGHGESTGEHITFGVVESRDLVQLTTWLQQRGLAGDTVGVYGVSYGASTAIEYSAIDPRVTAVVAVAPFATLAEEAPHFGRTLLPVPGLFLSDQEYTAVLADAGKLAGFDPSQASPLAAITHTHARVLLMHGDLDAITPLRNSVELHDAAPTMSELHVLKARGHLIASLDMPGEVSDAARAWFDAHLQAKATTGVTAQLELARGN